MQKDFHLLDDIDKYHVGKNIRKKEKKGARKISIAERSTGVIESQSH